MFSFVLDTNLFINLQRPLNLGQNKEEVLASLAALCLPLINKGQLKLLTTPESNIELLSFFKDQPRELELLNQLLTTVSPNLNNQQINAHLFMELIAETGKRLYRGLRTAEEPFKNLLSRESLPEKEKLAQEITQLREKYRRATREGFIDSTTDMGLILLSRETNSGLVTSDVGLLEWGRKFGCEEVLPEAFIQKMQKLAQAG